MFISCSVVCEFLKEVRNYMVIKCLKITDKVPDKESETRGVTQKSTFCSNSLSATICRNLYLSQTQQDSPAVYRLYKAVERVPPSSLTTIVFIITRTFGPTYLKCLYQCPHDVVQKITGGLKTDTPYLDLHTLLSDTACDCRKLTMITGF